MAEMRHWSWACRWSWAWRCGLLALAMVSSRTPGQSQHHGESAIEDGVHAGMAAPAQKAGHGGWGDQGDGTYSNPILPADFSDIDAIRVGSTYYAISSTFQYSPGMIVLASRDLVNWHVIGHVVDDLTRISPELGWGRMNRAGRGIWAGAIRYHEGRYWVYFGTPDEGLFMSTAPAAAGPWSPVTRVLASDGWDDPCPFWDDDGRLYLVATHYKPEADGRTYTIHLFELSADGQHLLPASDRIIHQSAGSEANKLYKIHGQYYHLYSEVRSEGRVIMADRARSLGGPWESRQVNHVHASADKEPNQGGLIELASGKWYFVSHQGTGDWEGRAAVLLPVTWRDDWPIIGKPGPDGIGNMVWHGRMPLPGHRRASPVTSDNFNKPLLRPEWEWQYQPRGDKWSLAERPGFLRLHAWKVLHTDDPASTGNMLTQRAMRAAWNQVTVQIDVLGMAPGQRAGLAHYAGTYAALVIAQAGAVRRLLCTRDEGTSDGPVVAQARLWLRSAWDASGQSQFSYSLDGRTYVEIGAPYRLSWGHYRGDRIALFTENSMGDRGFADFSHFKYETAR